MGSPRRIAGAAAVLVGIAIIVGGLTIFAPSRAGRGDRLIGLVQGELTDQGLADHQFDLSTWDAAVGQLQNEAIPFLAQRAGVDQTTFTALLRQQVPEVDAAITTLPGALPFAHKILDNLAVQQDNFHAAKDLPGPGLNLREGAWLLLLVGLVVAVLGVAVIVTDRAAPAVALVIVGALLVAGPLAVRFNSKADQTSHLLGTLNFDREVAARTRHFFEVTRDLLASVDTKIVPFAAATANADAATLDRETHLRFPRLATAIDHHAEVTRRFEARVKIREAAVVPLKDVKEAPLRSLGWATDAAGAVVLAAGVVGVASVRRRTTTDAVRPRAGVPNKASPPLGERNA